MTLFSIVLGAALVSLIAVSMLVMPALVRRTLPLGVSVPNAHVDDPVVRTAVRRYRVIVAVGWIAALLVVVLVAPFAPAVALLASILLVLVASVVAYLVPRAAIQRAKRAGGWYDEAVVRIVADSAPVERPRPPTGWFAASLALIGVVVAVGIAVYDRLPDPLPVHWNAAGEVDAYADKSIWSVFGPLLVGAITVVGLYALSFLVRVSPVRGVAADDRETNAARAFAVRSVMIGMLGAVMFAITIIFSWTTLVSWAGTASPGLVIGVTTGLVVVLLAVVALSLRRYRRAVRPGGATVDGAPDAPDDDRYWKAGMVYVNPDDPSFMVQKRFGVGWTVNLGHPGGIIAVVVLLAVIVALIVVPIALD